jgi:hypothetical protein
MKNTQQEPGVGEELLHASTPTRGRHVGTCDDGVVGLSVGCLAKFGFHRVAELVAADC